MSQDSVPRPLLDKIVEAARQSENGEAYQSVIRREHFRAGVIATIQNDSQCQFSVELLIRVFKPSSIIDSSSLAKATDVVRLLIERRYEITHEDDGWLCCRKSFEPEKVISEFEILRKILEGYYGDIRG